jgi:peroxiredoxin Q/BCP
VEILGASFDGVEDNAAFAKKFSYPFPLLCDEKREIGMAYGACEDPKDEYAKRISYVIGPDGRILQAHPKVSPKSHPQEILASLAGETAEGGR